MDEALVRATRLEDATKKVLSGDRVAAASAVIGVLAALASGNPLLAPVVAVVADRFASSLVDRATAAMLAAGQQYEDERARTHAVERELRAGIEGLLKGLLELLDDRDSERFLQLVRYIDRTVASASGQDQLLAGQTELRATLDELSRGIQELTGASPALTTAENRGRHGCPELPPYFYSPSAALSELKSKIPEGTRRRYGLHGMGGIGKTVLAAALVSEPEVLAAYPGGIYWLTLGQNPNLVGLQRTLLQWLTARVTEVESVNVGTLMIREEFAGKACLVVLDDVWQRDHVDAFPIADAGATMLITTREREILTGLGASTLNVELLTPEDATQLLAVWSGQPIADFPAEAHGVVHQCGRLPLALALSGALVRDGVAWRDIAEALTEGDLKYLEHADRSVFAALQASVRFLSTADAARYRELSIFPDDTTVPEEVILKLWSPAGLKERDGRRLLRALANKALLLGTAADGGYTVRFHDLQLDYLRLVNDQAPEAHGRLILAFQEDLPSNPQGAALRWAELDPRHGYLWTHLLYHLIGADLLEVATELATDARWLHAKARCTDVSTLLTDITWFAERADSKASATVATVLVAEAGWLHKNPEAIDTIVYNRLRAQGSSPDEIERTVSRLQLPTRLRHPVYMTTGRTYRGHHKTPRCCAYSPDGSRVISGGDEGIIREWDRVTNRELRRFEGHSATVNACCYSSDGTRILSASLDGTLREWDRATGRERMRFEGHTWSVTACAYSPDGARILSVSMDQTVREWERETGLELRRFEGHSMWVNDCAYSADATRLLSASHDDTVREWECSTGRELARFEGHSDHVTGVWYSPDGREVVSVSADHTIRRWDRTAVRETGRIDDQWNVQQSVPSADGSRILIAGLGRLPEEIDSVTGAEHAVFDDVGSTTACAYSPDEEHVLFASHDLTLREWRRTTARKGAGKTWHRSEIGACAFSHDGARVLSAGDSTIREWDFESGRELQRFEGHTAWACACAYSPDGSRIITGSSDETVREWDRSSGRELRQFEWLPERSRVCCYSPDGKRVLAMAWGHAFREWDWQTGEVLRTLEHGNYLEDCRYSPDGRWILSASDDSTIREWDAVTGDAIGFFDHDEVTDACTYSADGSRVLTGSRDGVIREWDHITKRELRKFSGHSHWVSDCLYSSNGDRIISASNDSTVKIWSRDGRCLETLHGEAPFTSVSTAGDRIAAGDARGNLWLFESEWLR